MRETKTQVNGAAKFTPSGTAECYKLDISIMQEETAPIHGVFHE